MVHSYWMSGWHSKNFRTSALPGNPQRSISSIQSEKSCCTIAVWLFDHLVKPLSRVWPKWCFTTVEAVMSTSDLQQKHTQPFYGSLDFVWDNLAEPVPEETFTHSHLSWSLMITYLLPPSIAIQGILPVQICRLSSDRILILSLGLYMCTGMDFTSLLK